MRKLQIAKQIAKKGVKVVAPYIEGKRNFLHPKEEVEGLAKANIKVCLGCEFYMDETSPSLMVMDERIPEATNKYCGDCFCILAYKIRQTKDICNKWQK